MGNFCVLTDRKNGYTDEEARRYAEEAGVAPRPSETDNEIDARGAFIRQPNHFALPCGKGKGEWRAESGRYAIYWAKVCNWSNRPVIVRDILGLEDVIADQLCTSTGESNIYGHGFADCPGRKDPLTGAYFLSEFYRRADPDFRGRATTPSLVDIKDKKVVNNDYHRMTNYIEVGFREYQAEDAPDLYPVAYRKEIDEFNDWLFPHINNSHYRMAFCRSYEAYNEAYDDFYESMDKLEKRLSENRFLFGDFITDSDIRFFVTLARWDIRYFRNIGPVKRRVSDYPNIWGYARELYNIPAFHKNTYMKDLAASSGGNGGRGILGDWNERIASLIDFDELWKDNKERARLSNTPDNIYKTHPAGETPEEYRGEISFSHWNSAAEKDRDPSDPHNSMLSADASVNPLKGRM